MNDYWDIDSLLSENFKIPCFFPFAIPHVEWEGQPIIANSRIELPFWMAERLALQYVKDFVIPSYQVDIEFPEELGEKARQDILASPACINLHELLPYYYYSGAKMSKICGFPKVVSHGMFHSFRFQAFKERLALIRQKVQAVKFGNSPTFLLMLDEFEKKVYKESNQSLHDFEKWASGHARTIQMASILK